MDFIEEICNEQEKISKQIELLAKELSTLHDEKERKRNIYKQINLYSKSSDLVRLLQHEIITTMKEKSSP